MRVRTNLQETLDLIWIDLILSHVLVYSEKYCILRVTQTKLTVCREGEKGSAECRVTIIARVQKKINLI